MVARSRLLSWRRSSSIYRHYTHPLIFIMPPGKSQVSLTELVASEKVQIDGTFLWSVLHQAVSCLVNISNKGKLSKEIVQSYVVTENHCIK